MFGLAKSRLARLILVRRIAIPTVVAFPISLIVRLPLG